MQANIPFHCAVEYEKHAKISICWILVSPSLRQVKSKTAEGIRVATKPCIAGMQEWTQWH